MFYVVYGMHLALYKHLTIILIIDMWIIHLKIIVFSLWINFHTATIRIQRKHLVTNLLEKWRVHLANSKFEPTIDSCYVMSKLRVASVAGWIKGLFSQGTTSCNPATSDLYPCFSLWFTHAKWYMICNVHPGAYEPPKAAKKHEM